MPDKRQMAKLLVDTVLHYHNNEPRAINYKFCSYNYEDKAYCAVGRCMTPAALRLFKNNSDFPVDSLIAQFPEKKLFLPQYNGIPSKFWEALQYLHDEVDNWIMTKATRQGMDVYALTLSGIKEIRSIIASYGLGPYIKFTNNFTDISIELKD